VVAARRRRKKRKARMARMISATGMPRPNPILPPRERPELDSEEEEGSEGVEVCAAMEVAAEEDFELVVAGKSPSR
jgi:hypothetical protein